MGASPQTPAAWSHRPDPATLPSRTSACAARRVPRDGLQCKVLLARCARGKNTTSIPAVTTNRLQ